MHLSINEKIYTFRIKENLMCPNLNDSRTSLSTRKFSWARFVTSLGNIIFCSRISVAPIYFVWHSSVLGCCLETCISSLARKLGVQLFSVQPVHNLIQATKFFANVLMIMSFSTEFSHSETISGCFTVISQGLKQAFSFWFFLILIRDFLFNFNLAI